ncbi:MAG: methyltransferase domain-containing protein [Anaerolineales bacterium]
MLDRRHGGDPKRLKAVLDYLIPVRDKILDRAGLREGETLLDVGCGDGLIGFGALQRVPSSQVIFSDISAELLGRVETLAEQMQVTERMHVLQAPAEDLSALLAESVDVVTTRSVLIYVQDKAKALGEFFRVLKPGGRLSIFEPINRFTYPEPEDRFCGYDVRVVADLAQKVRRVFERYQPADSDPMLDFDERDLIRLVAEAGFEEIHLEYRVDIEPMTNDNCFTSRKWEVFLNSADNPKITTMGEALAEALSLEELQKFTAHLRPLVEGNLGTNKSAVAYLWARKARPD